MHMMNPRSVFHWWNDKDFVFLSWQHAGQADLKQKNLTYIQNLSQIEGQIQA